MYLRNHLPGLRRPKKQEQRLPALSRASKCAPGLEFQIHYELRVFGFLTAMTTASAQPPARVPTPRPKHSRTSSLQSESAAAPKPRSNQSPTSTDNNAQSSQQQQQQQQPGAPRRGGGGARAASADPLSDKATSFLIRRILCPQQPDKGKSSPESIEDLLPPLTSRNDVDLQLYALIAIILREFVQNWYAKITPDETFVAEIVQIIAHITRALEQRLRKVDLESLLFDELPELLDKHVTGPSAPLVWSRTQVLLPVMR